MELNEYKNTVLKICEDAKTFAESNNHLDSASVIQTSIDYLKTRKITLAVCGEQNTGKSSLLGALINDPKLFPVDIAVATCLVTTVEYGETESITVVIENKDGSKSEIPITREQIEEYVTEGKNPSNEKGALLVKVVTPNDFLKTNGIVVCDLPGIGSLNPRHSYITKQFLQLCDVVIFAVDASAPMNLYEQEYLSSVSASCDNIIYAVTKADTRSASDMDEIIASTKRKIQATLNVEDILITPVSSYLKKNAVTSNDAEIAERNLRKSHFSELEENIWTVVEANRAGILILPAVETTLNELHKISNTLSVLEIGYSNDKDAIEKLTAELQQALDRKKELETESINWKPELNHKLGKLPKLIGDRIDNECESLLMLVDDAVKKDDNIVKPEPLYNEVQTKCYDALQTLMIDTENEIEKVRVEITEKIGLTLSWDNSDFQTSLPTQNREYSSELTLKKRISNGFGQFAKGTMKFGLPGAILVGAGVAVFTAATGGLGGAAILAALATGGSYWGAGMLAGAGIGAVISTITTIKAPERPTKPQIISELKTYINKCFSRVKQEANNMINQARQGLADDLTRQITLEKNRILDLIKQLQTSRAASSAETKIRQTEVSDQMNKVNRIIADLQSMTDSLGLTTSKIDENIGIENDNYAFLNKN